MLALSYRNLLRLWKINTLACEKEEKVMKNNDLLDLIKHVREVSIKNFEELSVKTNKDMGYIMVIFNSKTLCTRKVNDWGRESDNDWYLGIGENGWIIYTHTIESMAGPAKITDSNVMGVVDNYVFEYLLSDECDISKYLDFMEKCIEIRRKYYRDFSY